MSVLLYMHLSVCLLQTPIYIIQHLRSHGSTTVTAATANGPGSTTAAAAAASGDVDAAATARLPWLLLLSRLMVLRGKLLGHVLTHEFDESSGGSKAAATSTLHTCYWHVKMAHDAASTLLAAHLKPTATPATSAVAQESGHGDHHQHHSQQEQQQERLWSQLQLQLLPALKQAVQVLRAAMKLSRHYHETGFASGFAAGFAAGYAAAVAAASGSVQGASTGAPGPVSFASPWGVLQQGCIRVLPQLLQSVGTALAWQLRYEGCANPSCVNLSLGSELWLVEAGRSGHGGGSGGGRSSSAGDDGAGDAGGGGAFVDAALCCSCSKAGVKVEGGGGGGAAIVARV